MKLENVCIFQNNTYMKEFNIALNYFGSQDFKLVILRLFNLRNMRLNNRKLFFLKLQCQIIVAVGSLEFAN